MKFFRKAKDGGPESTVTAYWLAEIKGLFSIGLLTFEDGSRESYHTHAFNSLSWLLWGKLTEFPLNRYMKVNTYRPSLRPIATYRKTYHKVFSQKTSWVLTFRGPWSKQWKEYNPATGLTSILVNGRIVKAVIPE